MLILTRRLGESITIGDNIKVSILGVNGRQVRLGIDAPSDVIVHREEVYVRIQEENRRASKSLRKDLAGMVKLLKNKIVGGADPTKIGFKKERDKKGKMRPPRGNNR